MFNFLKNIKKPVGPSAPETQAALELRLKMLEFRVANMEAAFAEMCFRLRANFDQVDQNMLMLNEAIRRIAQMTIRPPKDLLNGGNEPN